MSISRDYEKRTEELLMPLIKEHDFELVDVEYVKEGSIWYLRAYIDKPGGITIDDCELISRSLSDLLDQEDFIEDSYTLEISSPGLDRPLKKDKDFARSLGERVEVKTYAPVDGQKEFTGCLKSYDKDNVVIALDDDKEISFARSGIAQIRLAFDF